MRLDVNRGRHGGILFMVEIPNGMHAMIMWCQLEESLTSWQLIYTKANADTPAYQCVRMIT